MSSSPWFLALSLNLLVTLPAFAADSKPGKDEMKEIAGSAEFLRSVPKHFATLKGMDRTRRRITLLMEGETQAREWPNQRA